VTLKEVRAQCENCRMCSLGDTRKNLVFGEGAEDADVMFIGEGPGETEDNLGRPFVGRAGQLLDDMLRIIDLDRSKNCYIANMVKCRPPGNRDPLNIEQECCSEWLTQQIEIIKPKIIVCLGRISAMGLIKDDFKITREHGLVFDRGGIKYIATFHPSALLRDPSKRPSAFGDLKVIQSLIRNICPETYNR